MQAYFNQIRIRLVFKPNIAVLQLQTIFDYIYIYILRLLIGFIKCQIKYRTN